MAKISVHVAYYMFLLTFCIDEGDSLWRKADRKILERDIKLYKKLAERVEHELQEYFYTEHVGPERYHYNFNRNFKKSNRKIPNTSAKLDKNGAREKKRRQAFSKFSSTANDLPVYNRTIAENLITPKDTDESYLPVKVKSSKGKWPKFEEILLEIGKKYDWKNDRWIKIKEKFKFKIKDKNLDAADHSIMFHDKHRFSYRTIKLNRGKNKRNVVIAVTAIR